jgi:hypothetical protein
LKRNPLSRTLELGDERGEIRCGRRIAFLQDQLQALVLGEPLTRVGHADPIGSVLVDNGDFYVLGLGVELGLRVVGQESRERLAILIGMDLGAEDVRQVLVLEHRR